MATRPVRVGARGSKLALRQVEEVIAALQSLQLGVAFDIRVISSAGDRDAAAPLPSLGVGVFVKELEEALLAGEVDMAVHSLKDLPTKLPDGLRIAAVGPRRDPRDALVSATGAGLAGLPAGARVGTGSPRRECLVKSVRPDLEVVPIRGNVPTRLAKLDGSNYDALVLAAAGLERLGLLAQAAELLDPQDFIPAPGQGTLAIEVRSADSRMTSLAEAVNHDATHAAVSAERAFLRALGGGCALPIGAYASVEGDALSLTGFIGAQDGRKLYRGGASGPAATAEAIGRGLAESLLAQGAQALVAEAGS